MINISKILGVTAVFCVCAVCVWGLGKTDAHKPEFLGNTELADKVEQLENQSSMLQRRLFMAEQRSIAAAGRPVVSDAPQEKSSDDKEKENIEDEQENSNEAIDRREDMIIERAKVVFDRQWRSESVDRNWTYEAQDALDRKLSDEALEGTRAESVECRTSLCRIETSHDGMEDWSRFEERMMGPPFRGNMFFNHDPETHRTVIYVARQGEALPVLNI
jgi:hypothetical protein